MQRGDLADMRGESADIGFHGLDAREEVLVGEDAGAGGDVLDAIALARLTRHDGCAGAGRGSGVV